MVSFSSVALALICTMAIAMLPCGKAQNSPQDFLDAHNTARAAVGVGPLVWSNNVAAFAQNYANMRRGDCMLTHSGGGGRFGENLFKGSGPWTARDAVQNWVNERQWYNYNSNSCFPPPSGGSCGHYTQVVWSNSVELGCARVVCNNGEIFITCNYNPPGNFNNQRPF